MTDTLELEIAMKRARLSRADVARLLNISVTALFNKMHNSTEFKVSEVLKLKEVLRLSNKKVGIIFFASNVDCKSTGVGVK